MKIGIVGPGAMGCLFAGLLARSQARPEIWLLDKDAGRARAINRTGITVTGAGGFRRKVKATANPGKIGTCELILLFTKSGDTKTALSSIGPLLGPNTNVLTLQNGLGNLELIVKLVGKERALGGATAEGATLLEVGQVRHAGRGETRIGTLTGRISGELSRVAKLFNQASIHTRMSRNVSGVIWGKLIVNAGINAVGAITRLCNGELLQHEGTSEILRRAAVEAARVARRKKIKLPDRDPVRKTKLVCRATAGNICSMLQDVIQKKRTEVDFINGAIVREGRALGVKTPVNEMLTYLVKAIEASYGRETGG